MRHQIRTWSRCSWFRSCRWATRVSPSTVWGEFSKGLPIVGGDYIALWAARVLTVVYFLFFLLMPWYTANDNERPEPARVVW